jgi:hypothetical protein
MTMATNTERAPARTQPMVRDQTDATPWAFTRERLANPETERTCWLATVRPDGRPHLMPIYRMVPTKAFGLPGMLGMTEFDRSELPKPTRYEFEGA